jgi:MFS superfamily sulfate permease-like transporter
VIASPPFKWFCFDVSAVDDVDFSVAETLRSLYATLQERGIRMVFAEVQEDVREGSRYMSHELIGNDAFYDTVDDVWDDYRAKVGDDAPA